MNVGLERREGLDVVASLEGVCCDVIEGVEGAHDANEDVIGWLVGGVAEGITKNSVVVCEDVLEDVEGAHGASEDVAEDAFFGVSAEV